MTGQNFISSFGAQFLALILSFMIVHLVYATLVRPSANEILQDRAERLAAGVQFVPERSLYVTLRDYEQETCFVLMIWALAIMGLKGGNVMRERRLLKADLVPVGEGVSILQQDTRGYIRPLQALPEHTRERLLPRSMMTALLRFESTHDIQNVSESVNAICENESDRLDSELTMIRYVAWAIPSIGFIGTVRGIGEALSQAYLAVQGDIAGVTESLGVAFNSTFVALVISIVVMLCLHQLQRVQERFVLDAKAYCDEKIISHMQVR